MHCFSTRSLVSTLTPRAFVSKQVKASTIIASEKSSLHKRAILPRFTEYLTHVLADFTRLSFPPPQRWTGNEASLRVARGQPEAKRSDVYKYDGGSVNSTRVG